MKIVIVHHHKFDNCDDDLLHNIFTLIKSIHTKTINIMADLTNLTQEVSEARTVMASAVTLLQGLKQKLDEAGADPVKLKELSDSLDTGTNDLAAAITANTPAEPVEGPPNEGTVPPTA
jgi:uncharacterized alpha-E superfamily protein